MTLSSPKISDRIILTTDANLAETQAVEKPRETAGRNKPVFRSLDQTEERKEKRLNY